MQGDLQIEQSEGSVQIASAHNSQIHINIQKPKSLEKDCVMKRTRHFLTYSIFLSVGLGAFFYGIVNMVSSFHVRILESRLHEFEFILDTDYNLVIAAIGLVIVVWAIVFKKFLDLKIKKEEDKLYA